MMMMLVLEGEGEGGGFESGITFTGRSSKEGATTAAMNGDHDGDDDQWSSSSLL